MAEVKRALILGTLAGQVDAIEILRARGITTFACGHERQGPGVDAADEFFQVDITDVDAVHWLAEELEVDLVYSAGSDIAMPTVVAVSKALDLPHFHGTNLTHILRRKEELRRVLREAGLSPVAYAHVASGQTPDWNIFPCFVKPVDAQGQRGITIVRDSKDLRAAVDVAKAASSSDDAIIEEHLVGPEVSAHVIVEDGVVRNIIPTDRHLWEGALTGIPSAHSIPLRAETLPATGAITELVTATVAALGVVEGPLYFQMIVTASGPRIIEIASRLDGCHLWRMIDVSSGYNILEDVLGRLCGDEWKIPKHLESAPTTLKFFLGSPDVEVSDTDKRELETPGGTYVEWQLEPGDRPRKTNPVVARLGYEIYPGLFA